MPLGGFSTSDSSKSKLFADPIFRFITASDGHYGQPNTDFELAHSNLIHALNKESNVDFVVFNGDLIHDEPIWMPKVKQVYDQLKMPYFVSKGNHDRVSETRWLEIWNQPSNIFFPNQEDYGIIILNSSNEAGDFLCVDQEFLRFSLEESKPKKHVFVFIHISQNDWTRFGKNCEEVMTLLGTYENVRAIFHGHDHDVDGIMWNRKKPYLWSGHFGGNWGNPFPSYRVCEVDTAGKIKTYLKRVSDGLILNSHEIYPPLVF